MRRLLFTILAMSLTCALVGCKAPRGVCDCSNDFEDHCGYRAPWAGNAGTAEPAHAAPAPAPAIKEVLPNPAKKL
jgi:hypothetical protein